MKIQLNSDLLAGIYLLPHRASAHDQSAGSCDQYLQLFASVLKPVCVRVRHFPTAVCPTFGHHNSLPFLLPVQDEATANGIDRAWWTEADLSRIGSCKAVLEGSDPAIKWLEWLPKYGSVIVAHAFPGQIPGTVALSVLGLDPHKLSLHGQRPGESGAYDFLGRASDFVELFAPGACL